MAFSGGMSKAKYATLSRAERLVYWTLVVIVAAFIGYMWFLY